MYTALKGQHQRLEQFLAKNANANLQTTLPGLKVPKNYTSRMLQFVDEDDNSELGFT